MIYLQLFLSYLKIGFFGFGGGYSMLSLIHNEVVTQHEWITSAALSDIVAISQMTPGPIAINSATYIGFTVAGFWGAVVATIAVCLPSLTIMALITRFFLQLKGNKYVDCIMATMKPVVLGMIGAASLLLIFPADSEAASMIDAWSWILFGAAFVASLKKIDPIKLIVLSAVAGIAIYYVPTMFAPKESTTIETKMLEDYSLSDTTTMSNPRFEQDFVNYLYILEKSEPQSAIESIESMMASASTSSAMTLFLGEMGEKYLYNPNSQMRNDELFIPILNSIISSEAVADTDKIRPRALLEIAMRNRPGDVAADFSYTTENGRSRNIHSIKADYTMLYFNNPDCDDCHRTTEIMSNDDTLNNMVNLNELVIVSVYPDADIAIWFDAPYPSNSIKSYDATCASSRLYDLKAIPTIYLLDSQKRVLLKDASIEKTINFLQSIAK